MSKTLMLKTSSREMNHLVTTTVHFYVMYNVTGWDVMSYVSGMILKCNSTIQWLLRPH